MYKRFSKKFLLKLFFIGCFFIIVYTIYKVWICQFLSFKDIVANAQWFAQQLHYNYWWMVALYCVLYIAIVLFCLPGIAAMNIMGGFLFGLYPGLLYILFCALTGAILFFLAARFLVGNYLQNRYKEQLISFNHTFSQKGWICLLVLRLIPLIPFFMVNIFAALTKISFKTFLWTTFLGIIPASVIFAYAGRQLLVMKELKDIFSFNTLGIFCLIILLVVVPLIINRRWKIF